MSREAYAAWNLCRVELLNSCDRHLISSLNIVIELQVE